MELTLPEWAFVTLLLCVIGLGSAGTVVFYECRRPRRPLSPSPRPPVSPSSPAAAGGGLRGYQGLQNWRYN